MSEQRRRNDFMTFAERLKNIRKQAGFSQEQLAEKLGVSRQAVTKWETEAGIPDIENIMAISALFGISIDEMLSGEKSRKEQKDFLFESITEYDIDEPKRFDLKFGGVSRLVIGGCDGEKIRVRLASNTMSALQNNFKVKIDDTRRRIDAELIRKNGVTEAEAKEAVTVFVSLPNSYLAKVETAVNAETVELENLQCESAELDAKVQNLILNGVVGAVEINCNLDMNIVCRTLCGAVELNQISATSRISVPKDVPFTALAKGIDTSLSYEKDGKKTEPFSVSDADNVIELNGMRSELVISTSENN